MVSCAADVRCIGDSWTVRRYSIQAMKSNYDAHGVLWAGYCQSVRFGAPLDMQTRLLAAAEDAERQENAARGEDNSSWKDENLFGLENVKNPDTIIAKALPPGN